MIITLDIIRKVSAKKTKTKMWNCLITCQTYFLIRICHCFWTFKKFQYHIYESENKINLSISPTVQEKLFKRTSLVTLASIMWWRAKSHCHFKIMNLKKNRHFLILPWISQKGRILVSLEGKIRNYQFFLRFIFVKWQCEMQCLTKWIPWYSWCAKFWAALKYNTNSN